MKLLFWQKKKKSDKSQCYYFFNKIFFSFRRAALGIKAG